MREGVKLDLSIPSVLDMYVQQVISQGGVEDIKRLFRNIGIARFKEAFVRVKPFLPEEVRVFGEDYPGNN